MKKPTIKVVYNNSYGSRNILSAEAIAWMKEHGYRGMFTGANGELLVPRITPSLSRALKNWANVQDGTKAVWTFRLPKSRVRGTMSFRMT